MIYLDIETLDWLSDDHIKSLWQDADNYARTEFGLLSQNCVLRFVQMCNWQAFVRKPDDWLVGLASQHFTGDGLSETRADNVVKTRLGLLNPGSSCNRQPSFSVINRVRITDFLGQQCLRKKEQTT